VKPPTTTRALLAGAAVLGLVLAACGGDDSGDDATDETAAETTDAAAAATTETTEAGSADTPAAAGGGGDVELTGGDVFVTGSSTVEPISIKVGELANELSGGELKVTVEGPGTGDGFQKFCSGEGDVTGASRAIRDEEAQTCADAGIEFTEIAVAIDGLTVATSPNNADVTCLDNAALYALWGPESEGIDTWAGANELAAELGSAYAELPDAPLVLTGPGEESGTYDTFVEFAIADIAEERGQEVYLRADYAASPNDNVIVEGIEGADSSLGFVGYAYYVGEQDRMKAVEVAGEDGTCVAPTPETIADGSYPFSRTLYIYVNNAKAAENPAVASYVDLYLSDDGLAEVAEAGYVDQTDEVVQQSRDAWAAAKG
jgi:phosphate transport system substrate-binding protein